MCDSSIIVTEIFLKDGCRHGRTFQLLDNDDYRGGVSLNYFFFGRKPLKGRNVKNDEVLYAAQHRVDYEIMKPVPQDAIVLDTIWKFYILIGYCYKTKKYT